MTESVDVWWVDGELLNYILVRRKFIDEPPMPDLVYGKTGYFNRSFFTQYRQGPFEILWAHRRRCLDNSKRTVAKFQRRNSGILRLDLYQGGRCPSVNADDVAEKPLQHIDVMACLISQHPTIVGPRAAPSVLIIVALVSAPSHPHGTQD